MKTDPQLSVVVITKNEEEDLPGFLKSFVHVADEIVIIDDGSSDRTKDVAANFHGSEIRFIESPRAEEEGFCDQRQKGVEAAAGKWLLQVDCDMRLTPELAKEIRGVLENDDYVAYRFRLAQYFFNRRVSFGGFQYWNQPWLSKRESTYWSQKVHEKINFSIGAGKIGQLKSQMIHLNDRNFSERLDKNRTYSKLEARNLVAAGKKIKLWHLVAIPIWKALRSYILMRGFLDGKAGFLWSFYQFVGSTTTYFLAWDMQNSIDREEIESLIEENMAEYRRL